MSKAEVGFADNKKREGEGGRPHAFSRSISITQVESLGFYSLFRGPIAFIKVYQQLKEWWMMRLSLPDQ